MTRQKFLAEYRFVVLREHEWAKDEAKLDRFMASVERTISTTAKTWVHDTPTVQRAWRSLGMEGRASLKALRALPDEGKANV